MNTRRGKWAAVKVRHGRPGEPWCSILFGGNGEHPLDCAYWPTWQQAYEAACDGVADTEGDLNLWLDEP